jgi:flagellar hook-length control protein FliK
VEAEAGPGPVGTGSTIVSAVPDSASPEDGPDLVDRIVQAAKLTQSRGTSRIKISLDPPNLGELKVDLSVRDRVLHGSLQAESPAAKEMILSHLQSLKDSLAEQGIQVGEFQVSVDPSFQQATQQNSGDGQPRGGGGVSPAAVGSEDLAGSVQERIRSARMQMIDMVA